VERERSVSNLRGWDSIVTFLCTYVQLKVYISVEESRDVL
jgi:hypothetical protein